MNIEMCECGGYTVTKDWAEQQTRNAKAALSALLIAEENCMRGYFPRTAATEAGFIRAKYPELAS